MTRINKVIRYRSPLLLPSWLLPWWIYLGIGVLRQQLGRFDDLTWACFRTARRKRRGRVTLLRYMVYRRDFGLRPFANWLESLAENSGNLTKRSRRFLFNGLAEAHGLEALARFSTRQLAPLAQLSPSVAAELKAREYPLSHSTSAIAAMYEAHESLSAQFAEYVRKNRGSICVVGNSATMQGSCVGKKIDQHQVVFRFNHFATAVAKPVDESVIADTGERLDVWVFSPLLKIDYSHRAGDAKWMIMSGPDARHHFWDWRYVASLVNDGHQVMSIPLRIWHSLVVELEAPPSAGILCLAWIIDLLGGVDELNAAGFQRGRHDAGRYHYALPHHKPSIRHNWQGERRLLRHWEAQGLNFLD